MKTEGQGHSGRLGDLVLAGSGLLIVLGLLALGTPGGRGVVLVVLAVWLGLGIVSWQARGQGKRDRASGEGGKE